MVDNIILKPNEKIRLADENCFFLVENGSLDLYGQETIQNNASISFYIASFEKDSLIFNLGFINNVPFKMELIAFSESSLKVFSLDNILSDQEALLAEGIVAWVKKLNQSLEKNQNLKNLGASTEPFEIEKNETVELYANPILKKTSPLFWLRVKSGKISFEHLKAEKLTETSPPVPLYEHSSIFAEETSTCMLISNSEIVQSKSFSEGLKFFHRIILNNFAIKKELKLKHDELQNENFKCIESDLVSTTKLRLSSILNKTQLFIQPATSNNLIKALQIIGNLIDVEFKQTTSSMPDNLNEQLKFICDASLVRFKKIKFPENFWKKDIGPVLTFYTDKKYPVALIPQTPTSILLFDPSTSTTEIVDEKVASQIHNEGYVLYKNFPENPSFLETVKYFTLGNTKDILSALIFGIASSLLLLYSPIAMSWLFDRAIPFHSFTFLYQVSLGFAAICFGSMIFTITQLYAVLRIESKMGIKIQSGLWGRLLSLRLSFFRKTLSGDLYQRVTAIDEIRKNLTSGTLSYILTTAMSLFYLIVMFVQNAYLALITLVPITVNIIIYTIASFLTIKNQHTFFTLNGKIYSFLVQIIRGIAKIRVAGAENRVISEWSKSFSEQKNVDIKTRKINLYSLVTNNFFSNITNAIVFSVIAVVISKSIILKTESMPIGSFLSFFAALGAFLSSGLMASSSIIQLLGNIIPLWKRSESIRKEELESKIKKDFPGKLRGSIILEQLSFRYNPSAPMLLKNISMIIDQGEFVAIIGPSGCGKSTLIRLLLGMEKPEKGTIYYDGRDLEVLDLVQVRKQIGSVLQSGTLLGGSLRDNITYGRRIPDEEIEEMLELCGFGETLKELPMGLNSFIPFGGGTLSGGQKQQIMIARALIGKPQILILDEATSALDAISQENIINSIERLNITRIVIAHRLSTIVNADTIYVMDNGSIVEQGSFQELKKRGPFFKAFAERQLANPI